MKFVFVFVFVFVFKFFFAFNSAAAADAGTNSDTNSDTSPYEAEVSAAQAAFFTQSPRTCHDPNRPCVQAAARH